MARNLITKPEVISKEVIILESVTMIFCFIFCSGQFLIRFNNYAAVVNTYGCLHVPFYFLFVSSLFFFLTLYKQNQDSNQICDKINRYNMKIK
jgi:hypothetical protein